MRLTSALILLILTTGNLFAQQDYLWPTSSARSLSSTFGETRAAHFHAGLDIKTWGREGYNVFATKDAILFRLGISADGYGKVIYLKHNDGTYSIYAHLQAFNNEIQHLADSLRLLDYSFELDKVVENYGIRVKQGDVIGFTGSTGIGPPHLHFELRDEYMRPFNALETNLKVKDELPPIFSSLRIEPAEKQALVRGTKQPLIIRPSKTKDGLFDYGPVESQGSIHLSVDVYDEANDVPNKYAVYQLTLLDGQDTLFHSTLSKYDYENASDMFLDRAIDPTNGRRRFQRLHIPEGSSVSFYDRSFQGKVIPPYPRQLTIIASDYYGNRSTASITITQPDSKTNIVSTSLDNVSFSDISSWVWGNDWVAPSAFQSIDLTLQQGAPYTSSLAFDAKRDAHMILHSSGESLYSSRLKPGVSHSFFSADRKFRLILPSGTVFDDISMIIPFSQPDSLNHTLQIFPQDYISKSKFQIQYYIDINEANRKQLGLYKFNRFKEKWDFIQSKRLGNTLYGWNNEFGLYAALPDTLAPEIGSAFITQNETGSWLVKVHVTDNLAGLDYRKALMYVNDIRGIAEYDEEEDFLIYYLPGFEPGENNSLYVEIKDRVGNTATKAFEIKKTDKSALGSAH